MSQTSINPDEIKHILFDLGGVLLNIDYNRTADAFKKLGIEDFDTLYSQAKQSGLFDDFEKGIITDQLFISELSHRIPGSVKEEKIVEAWNAMLLNFPVERISLLKVLKENYKLYLLSNTNEIHFRAFNNMFIDRFNFSFSKLFHEDYYSHLIGMRKPDHEIFRYVLKDQNIKIDELLFIDDSEQHIESARRLGIKSLLLEKDMEIEVLLNQIGILT